MLDHVSTWRNLLDQCVLCVYVVKIQLLKFVIFYKRYSLSITLAEEPWTNHSAAVMSQLLWAFYLLDDKLAHKACSRYHPSSRRMSVMFHTSPCHVRESVSWGRVSRIILLTVSDRFEERCTVTQFTDLSKSSATHAKTIQMEKPHLKGKHKDFYFGLSSSFMIQDQFLVIFIDNWCSVITVWPQDSNKPRLSAVQVLCYVRDTRLMVVSSILFQHQKEPITKSEEERERETGWWGCGLHLTAGQMQFNSSEPADENRVCQWAELMLWHVTVP